MSTLLTNITDLTEEEVTRQADLITQVLQDTYGTADFSKGTALYDLVIRPAATYHALDIKNADRIRQSSSLLAISQDPTLADDDTVDQVLSNYNVTRKAGNLSSGSVTIVTSDNSTTPVPENSLFTVGTLSYRTTTSYIGVSDVSLISRPTDRLMKDIGDGLFEFLIEVQAEEEGEAYQLAQSTTLAMQNPPPNFVRSYSTADFAPGSQTETNEQLIERLKLGAAGKTISSRLNTESLIREEYPDVLNVSIIGYQEADMRRDRHNIENKSHGGKSDVYVQPADRPRIIQKTLTATLRDPATARWQLYIDRDVLPGFYTIERVIAPEQSSTVDGTLEIVSRVESINSNVGTLEFVPELEDISEASFSRFQELTIEFLDPYNDASALAVNDTKDFQVDFLSFEGIEDMQATLSAYSNRAHRYDDLARYPIPVLVATTFAVRTKPGSSVNESAIKTAVAARVNNLGFCNQLSAAVIIDEVQDIIPNNAGVVMPIDMIGRLVLPDSREKRVLRSSTLLDAGVIPDLSISDSTVMFFLDPNDISIEVIVE